MSSATKIHQLDLFEKARASEAFEKIDQPQRDGPCQLCKEQYLTDHQVAARFSTSRASIWRWVKNNPAFPAPIRLSAGTTRWRLSDLVQFELNAPKQYSDGHVCQDGSGSK